MTYFLDSIYLDPYCPLSPLPPPRAIPAKIRRKGVLGVEHICEDDFYLIRILAACISG